MYAPGTPQRATRRSLSPTPDSFVRNHRQNYIPLRIPVTSGRGVATAKWVKVRMGVNPVAWGCMYKGGVVYQGDVHASPIRDRGATPDYTNEQLLCLHSDYRLRHEVDEALEQLGDKSLSVEVARYRGTMDGMQRIQ
jgi:2-keto-4-pentenoate hydratase